MNKILDPRQRNSDKNWAYSGGTTSRISPQMRQPKYGREVLMDDKDSKTVGTYFCIGADGSALDISGLCWSGQAFRHTLLGHNLFGGLHCRRDF